MSLASRYPGQEEELNLLHMGRPTYLGQTRPMYVWKRLFKVVPPPPVISLHQSL